METDEKRQNHPFIRNHYYPGKLLHADDFVNEQKYYNGKLQFINCKFHGCGIIDGLEVSVNEDSGLELKAGSGLDSQGRIIIVPEDTNVEASEIEGLEQVGEQDFVLGISYAEKAAGQERYFFKEEEKYHTSRVSEAYSLRAYRLEEWRSQIHQLTNLGVGSSLTQRQILYENEVVRLILEIPVLVPSDSIFRLRVRAEILAGQKMEIGWRITAKLQGGRFLESGHRRQILTGGDEKQEKNLQQEWDICTDEKRILPIVLELDRLEILQDGQRQERTEKYQFYIETSDNYREAIREFGTNDWNQKMTLGAVQGDWLPLSHLRIVQQKEGVDFQKINDSGIRFYTRNSRAEEMLQGVMDENGIVDIRWRHLLKTAQFEPVGPKPPHDVPEFPGSCNPEDINLSNRQKQWLKELLEEDRKKHICRGVAVISVPKRYRRGQVLYSEEISHGFPGEEVLLWCGRVWEERNYAYWDRDKSKYSVTHGAESLFPQLHRSSWAIGKQAICQDVDKGTFQIAITLLKGGRRNREKEVAISWVACRIV